MASAVDHEFPPLEPADPSIEEAKVSAEGAVEGSNAQ